MDQPSNASTNFICNVNAMCWFVMSILMLIEDLFKKSISTGSLKSSVLPKKKNVITIQLRGQTQINLQVTLPNWFNFLVELGMAPGVKKNGLDQVRLTLKRIQIWIPLHSNYTLRFLYFLMVFLQKLFIF